MSLLYWLSAGLSNILQWLLSHSLSPSALLGDSSATMFSRQDPRLFLRPLGILLHYFPVRALYPEPRTRLYEIHIYLHRSSLRALNCWSVQAYKTPNSCGECLLVNLLGVRPIPTGYSRTHSTNSARICWANTTTLSTNSAQICWATHPILSFHQLSKGLLSRSY